MRQRRHHNSDAAAAPRACVRVSGAGEATLPSSSVAVPIPGGEMAWSAPTVAASSRCCRRLDPPAPDHSGHAIGTRLARAVLAGRGAHRSDGRRRRAAPPQSARVHAPPPAPKAEPAAAPGCRPSSRDPLPHLSTRPTRCLLCARRRTASLRACTRAHGAAGAQPRDGATSRPAGSTWRARHPVVDPAPLSSRTIAPPNIPSPHRRCARRL